MYRRHRSRNALRYCGMFPVAVFTKMMMFYRTSNHQLEYREGAKAKNEANMQYTMYNNAIVL